MNAHTETTHGLSVDVEDWNNVLLLARFGKVVPPTSAVVRNTERLLELFLAHGARATWFVLGEVAKEFPELVRSLAATGQEIGVHGYHHHNVFDLTEQEFREYTKRARDVIQDVSGQPALGYRATSFSITKRQPWAFEVLAELGFRYDSSVFPFRGRRYGVPDAPVEPYTLSTRVGPLLEIPLTVISVGGFRLPCCGGGYLRHFPLLYTRIAMAHLGRRGRRAVFYLHPYEVDTHFDTSYFSNELGLRGSRLPGLGRWLQYRNREMTIPKLRWLLGQFRFDALGHLYDPMARQDVGASPKSQPS